MTVAVTGASGHIGGNLVRALLARGRKVRVTVRKDTRALEGLDVERANADVLEPDSLRQAFEGAEVVYHLAAAISIYGDSDPVLPRVNVDGTRNVVKAAMACGVNRLVHFSSIHALGWRPRDNPIDETRPLATEPEVLLYDRTKAQGELEVLAGVKQGLDAVTVNPTAVLGPFDFKPSHQGELLIDLGRRKMPALVEAGFDWVDVRDVVAGAMAAEQKGRTGERYLLGGHWATITGLARLVGEATGVKPPRFVSPMWLARIAAPFVSAASALLGRRPLFTSTSLRILRCHRLVSHAKAERELGYSSRPLEETVQDAMDWYKQAGMM
jgi:dihydroflavonol-4-reductase